MADVIPSSRTPNIEQFAVGEARWDELRLPLSWYFRAMADPLIRESQLSARP